MAEDLRRSLAKSQLQTVQSPGPRSKWAPGAWQAAAAYNATKPEVRCPVIVGGDSMLRSPEDLQDLCQLPSVPPLTRSTETTLFPFPDEEEDQDKKTLDIAEVISASNLASRTAQMGIRLWSGSGGKGDSRGSPGP